MIEMFTVFLVDDEPAVVKAMSRLLRTRGYSVCAYTSSRDFLAHHDPAIPGCALFDVSMPDLDGLELQQALTGEGTGRPVIFMTGKGDVPTSVRAMKAGAIDFLTKPVTDMEIFAALARAEMQDADIRQTQTERAAIEEKIATLTPREREVLSHVVAGRLNKQIAGDLGTVEKTIKVHRSRVMAKLGVRSVADLVRLVGKVGLAV
jgi:FixJ family two-component response regulator